MKNEFTCACMVCLKKKQNMEETNPAHRGQDEVRLHWHCTAKKIEEAIFSIMAATKTRTGSVLLLGHARIHVGSQRHTCSEFVEVLFQKTAKKLIYVSSAELATLPPQTCFKIAQNNTRQTTKPRVATHQRHFSDTGNWPGTSSYLPQVQVIHFRKQTLL